MNAWPSIESLANEVKSGRTQPVEVIEKALGIIKSKSEYNAVITVLESNALKKAKQLERKLSQRTTNPGKLCGVPFIAKDNYLVYGADTTAASNILKGFKPPYQATVINMLEAEGAICVAKANLDAFAHGASTENSDFFVTKNPFDKERVAGGSSGGSAASVALGMVPFALGTDTGGSTRQPASFVGVVGYKPTYGLISRSGIVAMASSTDTVGILANNVRDTAYVLDVAACRDPLDSTTIDRPTADYKDLAADLTSYRFGVIEEWLMQGLDPAIKKHLEGGIERLKARGAHIDRISLPSLPLALAVYYIVVPAEVSSNLARYDGQRFGYSYPQAKDLEESYTKSRSVGFGNEAKRRIMIGTHVLSSGYYDAYYKKAQTVRTKLINEFNAAFEQYDILLGPVTPTPAFKVGENSQDPLKMYLADVMTVGPSLVGCPAISIPMGTVKRLPVGLQLVAAQRSDSQLLKAANLLEEIIVKDV